MRRVAAEKPGVHRPLDLLLGKDTSDKYENYNKESFKRKI